jgi:hypothetical protein
MTAQVRADNKSTGLGHQSRGLFPNMPCLHATGQQQYRWIILIPINIGDDFQPAKSCKNSGGHG